MTVLVRPERVAVGSAPDGVNSFQGRIIRDRFLGAVRRYDLAVGEAIIRGETGHRGAIDSIHIRPEHVQLLAQ